MNKSLISYPAYVALSRATSIERLQIINFDPLKYVEFARVVHVLILFVFRVQAHPTVLDWMRSYGGLAKVPEPEGDCGFARSVG